MLLFILERIEAGLDMPESCKVEQTAADFNSREEAAASDVHFTVLSRRLNPNTSSLRIQRKR